jgi:Tol biopolymer transport system component
VAAGNEKNQLHVYLFDVTTGQEGTEPLTKGEDVNEWLPVLSPDRETMIYSREREGGHQLRTASAINGNGDRALFDESSLTPCGRSTGRPAWIPDTEELVMRCFGNDKGIRVVRVDVHGKFLQTYDKVEPDGQRQFGDPTVSRDGTTAVYFASTVPKARDGTLFKVDLETGDPGRLLLPTEEFSAYSDAVFSPATDMMAWRATTIPPEGADPPVNAGFEVLAAPFVDGELDMTRLVRVSGMVPGADQDPMFSPDGTQIIYGHSPPDDPTTTVKEPDVIQELWIASVANPDDRRKLSGDAHGFYAVPAWSRR